MKPSQRMPSLRTRCTAPGGCSPVLVRTKRRVPSAPSANDAASVATRASRSAALLVLAALDVVHARELLDLHARDFPRALHDPGERAVETRRFLFDLLEHRLGEVETLLALVGLRPGQARHRLLVIGRQGEPPSGGSRERCGGELRSPSREHPDCRLPYGGAQAEQTPYMRAGPSRGVCGRCRATPFGARVRTLRA